MQQQPVRVVLIAVVAGLAIPLFAGTARAHTPPGVSAGTTAACVVGCNMQKKGCIQMARGTALACKLNCRQTVAPTQLGSCMQGCMSTFQSSILTCRTNQKTCIAGCVPAMAGGGGSSCAGTCGMDLGGCAQGVASGLKTCMTGCRTATDRLTCVQGCLSTAQSGSGMCAMDAATCNAGCP
jgi:hypothetical protein